MDTSSLIIGLGAVLIFVVPFLIFNFNRKNRSKKVKAAFIAEASQMQMHIADSDIWNLHYCIGIDPASMKLLYQKNDSYKPESVLIDLNEIAQCQVKNLTRTVKNNNEKAVITEAISLIFKNKNAAKRESIIEIYNIHNNDAALTEEPQIAKKWEHLINSKIMG